ncbi:MAG: NAD-dependent glycerol-3-phosphate dehydrogenase domain protein, partial [Ramlibacter sp.]|nr:NAD-dependent glycerol-3-phosphate dehydrogenase domain protein [Ramlibacter sp.]
MRILVLGAGAWGTALAVSAAQRHAVTLWARDPQQAAALQAARENARYLPGIALPPSLQLLHAAQADLPQRCAEVELVMIATPMAGLRGLLLALRESAAPVAWLCKGFEAPAAGGFGLLGHEVRAEVAPRLRAGTLSGPSFAQEVARG